VNLIFKRDSCLKVLEAVRFKKSDLHGSCTKSHRRLFKHKSSHNPLGGIIEEFKKRDILSAYDFPIHVNEIMFIDYAAFIHTACCFMLGNRHKMDKIGEFVRPQTEINNCG
jgi:hypothetical protein